MEVRDQCLGWVSHKEQNDQHLTCCMFFYGYPRTTVWVTCLRFIGPLLLLASGSNSFFFSLICWSAVTWLGLHGSLTAPSLYSDKVSRDECPTLQSKPTRPLKPHKSLCPPTHVLSQHALNRGQEVCLRGLDSSHGPADS